MAKIRAYFRVGRGRRGYKISASTRPNYEPIKNVSYNSYSFLPTVSFAVDFDMPDELFKQAEKVIGEINIALNKAEVAAEVQVPELKKKK